MSSSAAGDLDAVRSMITQLFWISDASSTDAKTVAESGERSKGSRQSYGL